MLYPARLVYDRRPCAVLDAVLHSWSTGLVGVGPARKGHGIHTAWGMGSAPTAPWNAFSGYTVDLPPRMAWRNEVNASCFAVPDLCIEAAREDVEALATRVSY